MSDLAEVVFENVPKENLFNLLSNLIGRAECVASVKESGSFGLLDRGRVDAQAVASFVKSFGDVFAFFKLERMEVGGVVFPSVLLRLIKYGSSYDVDFNFERHEVQCVSSAQAIRSLHRTITAIAQENDVENWFAGMEPASDEDTRYFTKKDLGPLPF